jgi:pimeloyl-ACP methyl ester carboxylesterase
VIRAVMIPGLAMAASELPSLEAAVAFDNPEIGHGPALAGDYTLEDIAELHVRAIESLSVDEPFHLIGTSMGGMVLAVIAALHRGRLPRQCRFHFFVTTANCPDNPAISDDRAAAWTSVRPGNLEDFEALLGPFFSLSFRERQPERVREYCIYRAAGRNRQTARAYHRQMRALRLCRSGDYFARLDASEAAFIGGGADELLGPRHNQDLQRVCPGGEHVEIRDLGHMINIERPDLYNVFGNGGA